MTLTQQVCDLRLSSVSSVLRNRRHVSNLNSITTEDLLLHCGERRKSNVVLIASLRILSFRRHNPDNSKRQVHYADVLTNRIGTRVKIVCECLADHNHASGSPHV